jgi:NAD(P)-dependent dehydrogenase (short-subunit alcohol dehydrogenase family)
MADSKKYTNKLAGARVLVIGGSSGIGFSVAEAAVESGAIVHIASSSEQKVKAAVETILGSYPSANDRLTGHQVDLGNRETLESNVETLLAAIGQLDHVVYTSGDALPRKSLAETTVDILIQGLTVRYVSHLSDRFNKEVES